MADNELTDICKKKASFLSAKLNNLGSGAPPSPIISFFLLRPGRRGGIKYGSKDNIIPVF